MVISVQYIIDIVHFVNAFNIRCGELPLHITTKAVQLTMLLPYSSYATTVQLTVFLTRATLHVCSRHILPSQL
jgi:hypothetical protein